MKTPRTHHATAFGSAEPRAGSKAARRLRAVPPDGDVDVLTIGAQALLDRLTDHIMVAADLGVEPLTVDERATAMLEVACDGWRLDRRCREDGVILDSPHRLCLRAQYHHDVLLLEHGLLHLERLSNER